MKRILTLFATIMFLVAAHKALAYNVGHQQTKPAVKKVHPEQTAKQAPRTYFCKYRSGDVGTIVGMGTTKHAAHADAAEKCFDRRVSLFEKARGKSVDMDRGQDLIDSCVNITCS